MRGTRRSPRLLSRSPPPQTSFSDPSTSLAGERSRTIDIQPPDSHTPQPRPVRARVNRTLPNRNTRASTPVYLPVKDGDSTTLTAEESTSDEQRTGITGAVNGGSNVITRPSAPHRAAVRRRRAPERSIPSHDNDQAPLATRGTFDITSDAVPTTNEPNTPPSILRLLWHWTFRMIVAVAVVWGCICTLAFAPDALHYLQERVFPPSPIPLPYIAWSIGSNALHVRDCVKQISTLRASSEFDKASIALIAKDTLHVAQQQDVAGDLSAFSDYTQIMRSSVVALSKKAGESFQVVSEDIRKSHNLIRKIDKVQSSPSPRPFEVETKLVNLVEKLYTTRLPGFLRELIALLVVAEGHLHSLSDISERARKELEGETQLVQALQLVPPRVWKIRWERDPLIQLRVTAHKKTIESFHRVGTLKLEFAQTKAVFLRYWRSLELFQSPRDLDPNHRRSNGTIVDFLQVIDEVIPQLDALISHAQL